MTGSGRLTLPNLHQSSVYTDFFLRLLRTEEVVVFLLSKTIKLVFCIITRWSSVVCCVKCMG